MATGYIKMTFGVAPVHKILVIETCADQFSFEVTFPFELVSYRFKTANDYDAALADIEAEMTAFASPDGTHKGFLKSEDGKYIVPIFAVDTIERPDITAPRPGFAVTLPIKEPTRVFVFDGEDRVELAKAAHAAALEELSAFVLRK